MSNSINPVLVAVFVIAITVSAFCESVAQEFEHEHVQSVSDPELRNVVVVDGTKDGEFVYSCGFDPGFLVCFSRDAETGKLTRLHQYEEGGVLSLDISEDQKYLVTCSINRNKLVLFRRNVDTGALERLHEVTRRSVKQLHSPISVKFGSDSKFVYVTCASTGCLSVFSIVDDKLEFLQAHEGVEECLAGSRVLAMDPTRTYLYVASRNAGTISVFDRDEDAGHVRMLSHIMDDSIYGSLLEGVHGCAVCPEGKFLYAVSGRFSGDNAVSVFSISEDHKLKMVQEFENEVELDGFTGGNHVAVSPDGKSVYASGATSGNLAYFRRDPETGKLEFVEYLKVDGKEQLGMTAGIFVSSDNKFVYISGEGEGKIYVFKRSER